MLIVVILRSFKCLCDSLSLVCSAVLLLDDQWFTSMSFETQDDGLVNCGANHADNNYRQKDHNRVLILAGPLYNFELQPEPGDSSDNRKNCNGVEVVQSDLFENYCGDCR